VVWPENSIYRSFGKNLSKCAKGKKGLRKPNTRMCKNIPWILCLYLMIRFKNRTVKQLMSFLTFEENEGVQFTCRKDGLQCTRPARSGWPG
jgi:hypothetical protein